MTIHQLVEEVHAHTSGAIARDEILRRARHAWPEISEFKQVQVLLLVNNIERGAQP